MFSPEFEQIAAKVLGREIRSPKERKFIGNIAERKPNPQAFQGAVEFQKQKGAFASTNAEANSTETKDADLTIATGATGAKAGVTTGTTTGTRQDASDLLTSAIGDVRKKAGEVEELRTKLLKENERRAIRKAVLSDPEFQALSELKADLRGQVQDRDLSFDQKTGITDPSQVAQLQFNTRGDIARNASLLADSIRQRETGVRSTIDEIAQLKQDDLDDAQQAFENARSVLSDTLNTATTQSNLATNASTRKTASLKQQQLKADLQGGVVTVGDALDLVKSYGDQAPQALATLNKTLGRPNLPVVGGQNGFGYTFGEETFYSADHSGYDLSAPAGAPVVSHLALTVKDVKQTTEANKVVTATDSQGNEHTFMHLGFVNVQSGDKLGVGSIIGSVGEVQPGEVSTNPHLHYQIKDTSGSFVDPASYSVPSEPLKPAEKTKEATADEKKTAGFYLRANNSNDIITGNEEALLSLETADFVVSKYLPNFMKSPLIQSEDQAERDFVTAVLRRESGAAISDTEFDTARQQYFPQPGDTQATLDQKRKNRSLVLDSLEISAGTALNTGSTSAVSDYLDSLTK